MAGERIGLRREVVIFVPAALLLLVIVSVFNLLSHRNTLRAQVEDRRKEATAWAVHVAESLSQAVPSAFELRRLVPISMRVAIVGETGTPIVPVGLAQGSPPLPAPTRSAAPSAIGPGGQAGEWIVAFAPARLDGRTCFVRVDLAAEVLAAQLQSLRWLTWLTVIVNGGIVVMLLFFVRRVLNPYERLLARARELEPASNHGDEIAFLLRTFEDAISRARSEPPDAPDEIRILERALAPSLESGLLLIDRAGTVLALNPKGAELLEVETAPDGNPLRHVLAAHPELETIISGAVREERSVQREECSIQTSTGDRTLGLSVHPLRRDDGSVRAHLALFADLTEVQREAQEARLAESLSHLGELAAGVAHELRNGLATLKGYLTLVERSPSEESIADYLSEIRQEAEQLERTVADFLSFARPESVRLESVDLGESLARAAADPALADTRIRTQLGTPPHPRVTGDSQLLDRALRNLLHNAAQASGQSDEPIEVRLETDPDGAWITIADRGPGVPEEIRERLFQPFVTGRAEGVGLGLAIAHRIITLHRGRLRLVDREGGGTTAELVLPVETL